MITQEKIKSKIILFAGNQNDLKQACEEESEKKNFTNQVETLMKLKEKKKRAEDFISLAEPEIRELEKDLWQKITLGQLSNMRASSMSRLVKRDDKVILLVKATRDREIEFEEVNQEVL
jgi:hypothetical protein